MTERRETGRRTSRPGARRPGQSQRRPTKPTPKFGTEAEGERIAKYLARAGVASRRACETLIEEGKEEFLTFLTAATFVRRVPHRDEINFAHPGFERRSCSEVGHLPLFYCLSNFEQNQ